MKYLFAGIVTVFLLAACSSKSDDDYRITINYELGMHCTGFDFEYCCVLPPYNSIQAQVIKVGKGKKKPRLLNQYDPKDPTVLIDPDTDQRFRLKYEIVDNSFSEGTKMLYWDAPYDMNGNGKINDNGESVANAYFSHLYLYKDLEGSNPDGTSDDAKKLFVGGPKLQIPRDAGPSGQKLSGYLRNSSEKGTIVFTKSPVLDNTPIVLTNPGIWEALGLPLTPFLDSDLAGKDVKKVTEHDVQPYQIAKVTLVDAKTDKPVLNKKGKVVSFSGNNPIDVPNCSNCHSTPNVLKANPDVAKKVEAERSFWKKNGASDWYAAQKATSISILALHDKAHGTTFTKKYDPSATSNRLGRSSVLCQKCHGDNVIGVLGSGTVVHRKDGSVVVMDMAHTDLARPKGTPVDFLDPKNPNTPKDGTVIPPLTEALHARHLSMRPFADKEGRNGLCQGCHPAHRFDRSMDKYPITADGKNAFANADNRDAAGGCYVGRDVHSNPNKDKDGAGTPEHLNAIGQWLKDNVTRENGKVKGLWCTNCHTQISRELYKHDNLAAKEAHHPDPAHTLRDDSFDDIAKGLGMSSKTLAEMLDPKVKLDKKGHDVGHNLDPWRSSKERTSAAIGIVATSKGVPVMAKDGDGDILVKLIDANPNNAAAHKDQNGFAAPYDAATGGRDYWLSPGVPHCADCHSAPFTEGQGGVAFPINQPGKYSSMRYSKGHAGLACQSCHESIHGLYPVTPDVDVTTYKQAEALNPDGSHGPLKCQTCHEKVNQKGVPLLASKTKYKGKNITSDFDLAVQWIHDSAPDIGGAIPDLDKNGE